MTWMKGIAALSMGGFAMGALAIGCSSDPDPAPPDPLATEAGFCTELVKVICNATVVESCYGSVAASAEDDKKTCLATAEENFCNSENLVYRSEGAQSCIDAYKKAYADAALELTELEAIDKSCHKNLSGQGAEGDDCLADSECNGADDLRCVAKPGETGTCRVPVEVLRGDSCGTASDVCEDGYYCNAMVDSCIAEIAVGGDCTEAQPCNAEALCVDGACAAKESNGTTCTADEQCSGGFCDRNAGAIDGRCKAALPIVDANGQCDNLLP